MARFGCPLPCHTFSQDGSVGYTFHGDRCPPLDVTCSEGIGSYTLRSAYTQSHVFVVRPGDHVRSK